MLERELQVAKELARAAGRVVLTHYAAPVAVEYKSAGNADPVTQADKDANQLIVTRLSEAFPDDAILAEESPLSAARLTHRRLWCVDPVDGTREFIAHNGEFVVMIGLAIDGEARLGIVYQPTTDSLYWGASGHAYCETAGSVRELQVSRTDAPQAAVLMVSRSHRSETVSRIAREMTVRREEACGSVGLKVVRLAEGRADIYLSLSTRTHEWDVCAPEALLRAAGGLCTDVRGEPLRYNKETPNTPYGILGTNGALHADCVAASASVARERGWIP